MVTRTEFDDFTGQFENDPLCDCGGVIKPTDQNILIVNVASNEDDLATVFRCTRCGMSYTFIDEEDDL